MAHAALELRQPRSNCWPGTEDFDSHLAAKELGFRSKAVVSLHPLLLFLSLTDALESPHNRQHI